MKDFSHIDEHVWALINGQVDGDLNGAEQKELTALLEGSQELREIHAELSSLSEFLHKVPEKAPPEYLQNAITSTVRLPLEKQASESRSGFSTWLTEHWLGPVFALTAGVLLTVGVYETSPDTISPTDTAAMSGAIVSPRQIQDSKLIDRLQINDNAINGSAEVRELGPDLLIDVVLNSSKPNEFKLDYADNDLAFVGLASLQNQISSMSVDLQEISVESIGQQHYTLRFRGTKGAVSANTSPLKIDILVDNNLVQQAELKTGN